MPRPKTPAIPAYRLHKRSGQAIVTLSGRMFYLGPFDSPQSRDRYNGVVADWLANGRKWPETQKCPPTAAATAPYTVLESIYDYWQFAQGYYIKKGEPTSEQACIRAALRQLRINYGRMKVDEFSPLKLQELRQLWMARGIARTTINQNVSRIRRMFRWGVSQEKVAPAAFAALQSVVGLKRGRSAARESDLVGPVSISDVEATLPYLQPVVRDMVKIQLLSGCRPGEVIRIRPGNVDRRESVWIYRVEDHKTSHHEINREICFGPKAQEIVRPYLERSDDQLCFSPRESELDRMTRRSEARSGDRMAFPSRSLRKRPPGDSYTNDSYRRAIARACVLAKIPTWSPNQLRHTAATEIRKAYGLEAAQVVLGHAFAKVTQLYAERDMSLAKLVASSLG